MADYIVSARKYRPATFESVVGQKSVTSTLQNAIRTRHLAHAYLFFGPRGVGKTTCARIFAKTINCLNPGPNMEACNACESCLAFDQSRSYNIHELDAASNNSVEDIRSLIDMVRIPPQIGKYSVYIIDEVHMLSSSAFNAFLKTLEEPPRHAIFILATTEKHKILPTILSRCQVFDFNRINNSDIVGYLKYVAQSEQIEAEPEGLSVIAQKAEGAMRDALSFFDQIVSFSGNILTYQDVISNLNVLDYEYYFRLTDCFLAGDLSRILLIYDEILRKGFDGQHFLEGLGRHFRNLLVSQKPETIELLEVGEKLALQYREQAARFGSLELYHVLETCNSYTITYRTASNARFHVELALVKCCHQVGRIESVQPMAPPVNVRPAVPVSSSPAPAESSAPPKREDPTPTPLSASGPSSATDPRPAVPPPAPPRPTANPLPKQSLTPSIKTAFKTDKPAPETPTAPSLPVQAEILPADRAFTENDLLVAWKKYSGQLKETHPRLHSFFEGHSPEQENPEQILIKVENESLGQEFRDNMATLVSFFRKELMNDRLLIEVRVTEVTTAQKVIYTQQQKLDYLKERNPHLGKFTESFQLDFE